MEARRKQLGLVEPKDVLSKDLRIAISHEDFFGVPNLADVKTPLVFGNLIKKLKKAFSQRNMDSLDS